MPSPFVAAVTQLKSFIFFNYYFLLGSPSSLVPDLFNTHAY